MWRGTVLLCCMEWDMGMWPLYFLLAGVCSCHFRIHYHRRPAGTMGMLLMIAIFLVGTGDGGLAYISFLHAAIFWCPGSHCWTRTSGVFNSHGKWHIPRQYGNETELHTVQSPINPLGFSISSHLLASFLGSCAWEWGYYIVDAPSSYVVCHSKDINPPPSPLSLTLSVVLVWLLVN